MRPQSLIEPIVLLLVGIAGAIYCAANFDIAWTAICCLVAGIGWNELRATSLFNDEFTGGDES